MDVKNILAVALLAMGCTGGVALPGDEADSCPAEYEVQACDVACVSGELMDNALFSTCETDGLSICVFGCLDVGDGVKECGCCHDYRDGEIRVLRWEPCL